MPDALGEWRSFGGTAALDVAAGDLFPLVLIISPDRAILHARMTRPGNDPRAPGPLSVLPPGQWPEPQFADVTIVDDHGARYAFHVDSSEGDASGRSARLRLRLSPVPGPGVSWLELRGPGGAAGRLLPSPRPVVRVGPLGPAALIPAEPTAMPDAGQRADGPRYHLDLGMDVPRLDDVTVRADALVSEPDGWRLYLRAMPAWWKYSADRRRKWSPISVQAADDRGGTYVSAFGGSTAYGLSGYEELILRYLPCLDPDARVLRLTFLGAGDEVTADFDLPLTAASQGRPVPRPR